MALEFDPNSEPETGGAMPEQWQALDQFIGSPQFQETLKNEFPEDAPEWLDPVTRRRFLQMSGASIALATAVGCNPSLKPAPERKVLPYVKKPEAITPGVPLFFTSTLTLGGYGLGVLVKSHEGRPVKVEGNPSHPASLGSTDLFAQASVLGVYDPDRSKSCMNNGVSCTWDKVRGKLLEVVDQQRAKKGAGFRIVTDATTSPTFAGLMDELKKTLPDMKWIQYEAVSQTNALQGGRLAYGKYVNPVYSFKDADVILSLDADFLGCGPGNVRYSRDAMARRKVRISDDAKRVDGVKLDGMNRIYSVESMTSNAGFVADHRLPLKPTEIESFLRRLATELGVAGVPAAGPLPDNAMAWIKPVAADLKKAAGKCIVVVGDHLPASAHAIVHAVNHKLGAVGKTVTFTDPVQTGMTGPDADVFADGTKALATLTDEMKAGKVDALIVMGSANPVYSAPADVDFAGALKAMEDKKQPRFRFAQYEDETTRLCDWHINEAHQLESWGDARAHDGTASLQQPLIASMTGGKSAFDVLTVLLARPGNDDRDLVKATWQKHFTDKKIAGEFDDWWHTVLEQGIVPDTAFPAITVGEPKITDVPTAPPATVNGDIELVFRPDPTIYDGRFANSGWLQELPKPMTCLTWDNALIMSPATADKLQCGMTFGFLRAELNFGYRGGEHGRTFAAMVQVTVGERKVEAAVFILPGHADDCITFHLGYGRFPKGHVQQGEDGKGLGFNAYTIRTSEKLWVLGGLKPGTGLVKTGAQYTLAAVQGQHAMEGRRPARHGTIKTAEAALEKEEHGDHQHLHVKGGKYAFDFADNPNAASAEKGNMRAFLPGTPEERIRLTQQFGAPPKEGETFRYKHIRDAGYKDNRHDHDDHHAHHDHDKRVVNLTLISDHENNKLYRRWAMAIDLGACTGCSACVAACVAENNTPVIGKTEVTRGRIMHWIRVDRYFSAPEEQGGIEKVDSKDRWESLAKNAAKTTTYAMPVPCQQCEKAPCEVVCPVAATTHSDDGLNDMAYNRCVGTRYCANNCPYKVRRFNFLQYADYASGSSLNLVNNPEVTVRTRGVMEKCTYCVQRIRAAEIEAEREIDTPNRRMVRTPTGIRPLIEDGEIKTACQAACPSQAIMFGDLNQDQYTPVQKVTKDDKTEYVNDGSHLPFSAVSRWKLEPTHYGLLSELNTMPRTSYLAAIKNPNPDLEKGA